MKQAENRLSRFEAEIENLNKVRKEYENVKNTGKTFFTPSVSSSGAFLGKRKGACLRHAVYHWVFYCFSQSA